MFWKKSLLVICKIWRLFVNTFTSDNKYSLLNRDKLMQPIDRQLSQKQKTFSRIVLAVLKSRLNFAPFQKKMRLIADLIPKLLTPKNVVRWLSKKSCFGGSFEKQDGKGNKHKWNPNSGNFTIFIDYSEGKWVKKFLSQWYAKS